MTVPATTDWQDAVRSRLAELHPGASCGELRALAGGHSGLTYVASLEGESTQRLVVKVVPPGQRPIGRNDVLRQAQVLRALAGSDVPVPRVVAWSEDEPQWFAMTFEAGVALEPVMHTELLDAELVAARFRTAARTLAALHTTSITALALPTQPEGTPQAELARWSQTMKAVPATLTPGAESLLSALGRRVPPAMAPTLVHGDYRLGNLLFRGTDLRAVVDWEIWGVGDPRVDLAWFLTFLDPQSFPTTALPGLELPSVHDVLEAYDGDVSELGWFCGLARMKLAAIMGHNLRRHREGKHDDPYMETLPGTIAALIQAAGECLEATLP